LINSLLTLFNTSFIDENLLALLFLMFTYFLFSSLLNSLLFSFLLAVSVYELLLILVLLGLVSLEVHVYICYLYSSIQFNQWSLPLIGNYYHDLGYGLAYISLSKCDEGAVFLDDL
jgi:hypothetical protein